MEITKETKQFSLDEWLREAKNADPENKVGMYLFHIGKVRSTARCEVRDGQKSSPVRAMLVSTDQEKVALSQQETLKMKGINYCRVEIITGTLKAGDDIMRVIVGGDIRPNVIPALESLVAKLKTLCIVEEEIH